jgi:hypothetical protein
MILVTVCEFRAHYPLFRRLGLDIAALELSCRNGSMDDPIAEHASVATFVQTTYVQNERMFSFHEKLIIENQREIPVWSMSKERNIDDV